MESLPPTYLCRCRKAPASPYRLGPPVRHSLASRAGYQALMPGSSRQTAKKRESQCAERGTTIKPGGFAEATGQRQIKRVVCKREAAGRKKRRKRRRNAQARNEHPRGRERGAKGNEEMKKAPALEAAGAFRAIFGSGLLSSAMESLTTEFGMGSGVPSPPWPPKKSCQI